MSLAHHAIEHRPNDLGETRRSIVAVIERAGRECAHAAGFGPRSSSKMRLWSCADDSDTNVVPSASTKYEASSPDEKLFEHDPIAGSAEAPIDHHARARRDPPSARSSAITTPLPAARPSALRTIG